MPDYRCPRRVGRGRYRSSPSVIFGTLHSESLNHPAYGDYASYREFGRHHRICTANRHLDVMRKKPESQWIFSFGSIAAYYLFPNINMVFAGGMVVLVRVYPHPTEVGRSISRISHFEMPHIKQQLSAATTTKPGSLYKTDHSNEVEWDLSATVELLLSTVEHEDYWMAEQAQITANSGKVENFLFGRNEPALQHFHKSYRELLGDPPLHEYNAG